MAFTRIARAISATGVLLGFLWVGASAHAGPIEQLRFSTGFSFMVNGKMMPPGTYVVRRIGSDPRVLEISNRIQKGALVSVQNVRHAPGDRPFDAGVVFEGAGEHFVLRTLWDDASGSVESITAPAEIADTIERRPLETRVVPATVMR